MSADAPTGWPAALDALEAHVEQAQALAADGLTAVAPSPWLPEPGLGPLPASLEPRARRLLDAQASAAQRVAEAAAASRRHLDVVSVLRTHGSQAPVYLDVEG